MTVPEPLVATFISKVVPLLGDTWVIEVIVAPRAVPLRIMSEAVKEVISMG